jgi:hypothetical protein
MEEPTRPRFQEAMETWASFEARYAPLLYHKSSGFFSPDRAAYMFKVPIQIQIAPWGEVLRRANLVRWAPFRRAWSETASNLLAPYSSKPIGGNKGSVRIVSPKGLLQG